jgi:hypothetical protein
MKEFSRNQYEQAFENWLLDNAIQYIPVDERKRAAFSHCKVKSFDFLLYPRTGQVVIAEVKGRRFKGAGLAKLAGFECWVTADDVDGLVKWQEVFGAGHQAIFVFAYKAEKIDVDFDGREFFEFNEDRYIFFAVKLSDYRSFMKRRSPKWKTVTLPADRFRQCAVQISELLL